MPPPPETEGSQTNHNNEVFHGKTDANCNTFTADDIDLLFYWYFVVIAKVKWCPSFMMILLNVLFCYE